MAHFYLFFFPNPKISQTRFQALQNRQTKATEQHTALLDDISSLKLKLIEARASHSDAVRRVALHEASTRRQEAQKKILGDIVAVAEVAGTTPRFRRNDDRQNGDGFAEEEGHSDDSIDLTDLQSITKSVESQNKMLGAALHRSDDNTTK